MIDRIAANYAVRLAFTLLANGPVFPGKPLAAAEPNQTEQLETRLKISG